MINASQRIIGELRAALYQVRTLTAVALRKGHSTDDIPEKVLKWFLFDANDGTGWADVRVRFPKVHYASRARRMNALHNSGLSYAEIGRMYGITEEGAQQAAQNYRESAMSRDT